jgi:L-amino acid N-acyltransferase YncA
MEIRFADPSDGLALQAIYGPIVTSTPISFEWEPPTAEEMARRVRATLPEHPWLVAEGDRVLGYAYATPHQSRAAYRWSTDVSVYVDSAARGQGVGTALYAVLFRLLQLQGFREAFAGITLPNTASVALHESLGFVRLGVYRRVGWKLGAWHDVGHWQHRMVENPSDEPGALRSIDDLAPNDVTHALGLGLPPASG